MTMPNNRVIKFRAWGFGDNKEMMMYDWSVHPHTISEWIANAERGVTIMQFTGLHDKNGVEIWEGDIISLSANAYHDLNLKMLLAKKGHLAEVIFQEGNFIWYVGNFFYPLNQLIPKTVDKEVRYMFLDALNCNQKGLTCEVLGNIHQHPNLLESKS